MAKRESNRQITIRSIRKDPPDLSKLGRALIALAAAKAEAEAQAEHKTETQAPGDLDDESLQESDDER